MTNDIPGIQEADVILVIGSDTTAAHPVISARIKQAVRKGKTRLIVIDPKKIRLADYAEIYAAQKPGSDVALLNSIMHEILKNGWEDKEYIEKRLEGFEEFYNEIIQDIYAPENITKICGIDAKTIKKIAELFGKASTASVFYAMGITQHTTGVDNVWSIANLQMICGNIGKVGGGVNPLRGQSNVQGACDMGGLPDVYPGYQRVTDPKAQAKFEAAWNCKLDNKIGLHLTEMFDAVMDDKLKALYVMGENPVLSDPNQSHILEAIEKLDFLVVQDIFLSETAQLADIVLPAASFLEKEGHFTNTERRVQRINKAIESPGEAQADWKIITQLANKMGGNWQYNNVKEITDEITKVTPQYAGITWDRTEKNGLQWPCPNENHPGTKILHKDVFTRGKGKLKPFKIIPPDENVDEDYPFILTTGRVLQHYHTGTMTRKTEGLDNLAGPMVMISVFDAENLGIENSETVEISTRRGSITAPAFITKRIQAGVIYIPFHYWESPVNKLTNPALDPIAKIPELKVAAANVKKL
jgi:formate dehydrogenase major subunit